MSTTGASLSLSFRGGTLELTGLPAGTTAPPGCLWDPRTACFRAPAAAYAELRRALARDGHAVDDRARGYAELPSGALVHRDPRPYQAEALVAWRAAKGRGVVVLPTGAGKTHVACLAIDDRRRSTLVLAPTLDLVRQWYDVLRATFGVPVGVIGGGDYGVEALTVSTYDSAYLHMEHLGDRFGLLVFDECHHLPGPAYALAARAAVAPFRLGLTATPERADGRHADLDALVGPIIYRKDIVELSGAYLATYETVRLTVELGPGDRRAHDEARATYRDFLARNGIRMSSPSGWSDFIIRSSRSDDGRRAMEAYRRQREIAFAAPAKLDYVGLLLERHRDDRVLLFTQDNATAYALARRFLVPIITHETRIRERSEILAGLARGPAEGGYGAVVTSKVLNEGVDIPEANVAVVVSGSASVREHVQRLGRILRAREGKHALLYELVTANTAETFTSARRRDHSAYR
ncbi:MAG TPA: DEAD/DEAH box helicase family protein [Polyangia bacterium]|nr:DEAD/DEAH box helicase family protein [Polyangia bacterium]